MTRGFWKYVYRHGVWRKELNNDDLDGRKLAFYNTSGKLVNSENWREKVLVTPMHLLPK